MDFAFLDEIPSGFPAEQEAREIEKLMSVLNEQERFFNYDGNQSLLENVNRAAQYNQYSRNGQRFRSHGYAIDEDTEELVSQLDLKCRKRLNKYFVLDYIYYDEKKDTWTTEQKTDIYADVICVDKIKVWTGPRSEHLMSVENATNSLSGYEKRDSMARYKRTDNTQTPHPYTEYSRTNRTNINMTRGIHEFVLLNRIMSAHNIANNPYGGSTVVISRDSENNNSLAVDSVINGIINGLTFKATVGQNNLKDGFSLTQMASFGTHKSVVNLNELNDEMKSKMTESEIALEPLSGAEIQVHEACFNCSAVRGSRILPDKKRKGSQMLNDKKCITRIALNNAKAEVMKIPNSLIWNNLNTALDLFCWENNTHKMTRREEMRDNREIKPVLENLHVSRDNYAQAASFPQHLPKIVFLASTDINP